MIATAFGFCLSALPALPQDPTSTERPQEPVLLTYPLRELTGRRQVPLAPPIWSVLGGPFEELFGRWDLLEEEGGFEGRELPTITSETMLDFLGSVYAEDLDERLFLHVPNPNTLWVRGEPGVARAALETLRRVESILARPIRIDARLYDWEGREAPPATVSADELAELTDGIRPLWSSRTSTRSAVPVGLGQERRTRYLREVQVKIAQGSSLADPAMAEMFEGVRVNVEPHALIGTDELVLMCQFAIAEQKRPMAVRDTGISGIPTLDVPFVDMDTGAMSGRVPPGGALLYCAQSAASEGSSVLLAISAEYERDAQGQAEDLRSLPISAMTSKALTQLPRIQYGERGRLYGINTFEGWLGGQSDGFGVLDPGAIQELVFEMHPDAWDDYAFLDFAGGYLFLRGDRTVLDDTQRLLVQLQDRSVRNAQVEVLTEVEEARAQLGPIAGAIGDTGFEPLHRIVFPALLGRSHVSFHGVETTSIEDIANHVAQAEKKAYPVVDYVFGGTQTFALPYAMEERLGLRVRLDLLHVAELERRSTDLEGGADLYPSRTGVAYFTHHGRVESGQYIDFGVGPTITVDNRTYRTRQRVRVSLR